MGYFPSKHYNSPMEDNSQQGSSTKPNSVLVSALRKVLRPLVGLMIENQITYTYLINLLKSIYVEVAVKEFPVAGKKQTDSRINLLTGVHRKDVKRLRSKQHDTATTLPNISIGAQLIARWLADKDYQDENGMPRALALRSQQSNQYDQTFDTLVEKIAKQDIRPRVVLDELQRLEMVDIDTDGRVNLKTTAFTPDKDLDKKLFFFGKNIHDHICAGAHNLAGKKPAFFDRSVYYDQLSQESIATLNVLCNEIGMEALMTVNEKALALQTRDAGSNARLYRMNFGIFNFNTPFENNETEKDTSAAAGRVEKLES